MYSTLYKYNGPDSPLGPAVYLDAGYGPGYPSQPRLTLTRQGMTYTRCIVTW